MQNLETRIGSNENPSWIPNILAPVQEPKVQDDICQSNQVIPTTTPSEVAPSQIATELLSRLYSLGDTNGELLSGLMQITLDIEASHQKLSQLNDSIQLSD